MSNPGPGRDPGPLVAAITVAAVIVAALLLAAAIVAGVHP